MVGIDAYVDPLFFKKLEEYVEVANSLLAEVVALDSRLHPAMSYCLDGGGKRIRPVLAMASAAMLGVSMAEVCPWAVALEYVHTSSLIHDDLPAIDDDDFRRGRETCHRKFGEAIAILSGDAFLSEAFRVIATAREIEPAVGIRLVKLLAEALSDICSGQVMDLDAVEQSDCGQRDKSCRREFLEQELREKHLKKTAALIKASVMGPALFLRSVDNSDKLLKLNEFGASLGVLYQIVDDINDSCDEGSSVDRKCSSDVKLGRVTYVSFYGLETAREMASEVAREACSKLSDFGHNAWFLRSFCRFVLGRCIATP